MKKRGNPRRVNAGTRSRRPARAARRAVACSPSAARPARTPPGPRRAPQSVRAGRRARSAAGGSRRARARREGASTISSAGLRAGRHRDGDGAVELDDRRGHQLRQPVVEGDDPLPIGVLGGRARAWHAAMLGLQRVRPDRPTVRVCALERRAAPGRPAASPSARDPGRAAAPARPSARFGRASRDACSSISATQPVDLRLPREQLGEDPSEPQRLLASARAASSRSPAVAE